MRPTPRARRWATSSICPTGWRSDKLVKEANQAAKKLDKEADQKATALLDKAKKQSDQILADAGAKAKLK